MGEIKTPRGTRDLLPESAFVWEHLRTAARKTFEAYGYKEIITPTFESTDLFARSIGEYTDIVQKEMYNFLDKAERRLTLRPEGTAPIVRAYIQHNMNLRPQPVKLYYLGQMFRYERPQAGRYREFSQFGVEALGSVSPSVDAEMILMLDKYLKEIKVKDYGVFINSMGCESDRQKFVKDLVEYLQREDKLCKECTKRAGFNPLRVFDCKNEGCRSYLKNAPKITDYLCEECSAHFTGVKDNLDRTGLGYETDKTMVRGFDYYTRTIFEIRVEELGAQNAIAGGGRYDNLVKQFGGPDTPAVGFAIGVDRMALVLKEEVKQRETDIFIANIDEESFKTAFALAQRIRQEGLLAEIDYMNRSLRSQLNFANKTRARYVAVIGPDEVETKKLRVKNMESGEETEATFDEIVSKIGK